MVRSFFNYKYMSLKYKRVLLKLSGESLMGDQAFGIQPQDADSLCGTDKGCAESGS